MGLFDKLGTALSTTLRFHAKEAVFNQDNDTLENNARELMLGSFERNLTEPIESGVRQLEGQVKDLASRKIDEVVDRPIKQATEKVKGVIQDPFERASRELRKVFGQKETTLDRAPNNAGKKPPEGSLEGVEPTFRGTSVDIGGEKPSEGSLEGVSRRIFAPGPDRGTPELTFEKTYPVSLQRSSTPSQLDGTHDHQALLDDYSTSNLKSFLDLLRSTGDGEINATNGLFSQNHLFFISIVFGPERSYSGDGTDLEHTLATYDDSILRMMIQSATIPNLTLERDGDISNWLGYSSVGAKTVVPDSNTFTVDFLSMEYGVHETLFIHWLKEIGADEYMYPDYPFKKAQVRIDIMNSEFKYIAFSYVFEDCFPEIIETLDTNYSGSPNFTRNVSFKFNTMWIEPGRYAKDKIPGGHESILKYLGQHKLEARINLEANRV